jgi:hypothetical protein
MRVLQVQHGSPTKLPYAGTFESMFGQITEVISHLTRIPPVEENGEARGDK